MQWPLRRRFVVDDRHSSRAEQMTLAKDLLQRASAQQAMSKPRLSSGRVRQHLSQFRAALRGAPHDASRLFGEPARFGELLHAARVDAPACAAATATLSSRGIGSC